MLGILTDPKTLGRILQNKNILLTGMILLSVEINKVYYVSFIIRLHHLIPSCTGLNLFIYLMFYIMASKINL